MVQMTKRCDWAKTDLMIAYHDKEWGVPVHDDRTLFEFLILEGAQAGLSWEIILRKRDNYRARLLGNAGIIRNRLKIGAAIQNARAFLEVQKEFGSFDAFIWQFIDGKPRKRKRGQAIVATSPVSDAMSKDLSRRGFKFVGSTICYAFMQAVGMVNDHNPACFRYNEVG